MDTDKIHFGEERSLKKSLKADLTKNEGCGIAFRANKDVDFTKINAIKFIVSNLSSKDITLRVEKKFSNDVKTGFEQITAHSSKRIKVHITNNEKEIKEVVLAVLREENPEDVYSIVVNEVTTK